MSTQVHPTACVDPSVELGDGVRIEPYAIVRSPCAIGDGTWIGPHAALGLPAQMRDGSLDPADGAGVSIGADCVIREFATVHQGTERSTTVGDRCYLMAYAHVPHDALLGVACTLSNSVQMGGHTWVGDGANIGLGATVHQRSIIGSHAMVGMQSTVTRAVRPFTKVVGVPARPLGVNIVALARLGVTDVEPWMEAAILEGNMGDPRMPELIVAAFDRYAEVLEGSDGGGR